MAKVIWANFIHLYQPPFQQAGRLRQINRESYQAIINFLNKYPKTRLTVNFSGSLTELLIKNKLSQTIKDFKSLATRGQIEFVSSAKYHPILPLLPENEIKQQVKANDKINKAYFGAAYNPTGFYFPEMSFSAQAGKVIKSLGYKWTVLDEIHNPETEKEIKHYKDKGSGLDMVFRKRSLSKAMPLEVVKKKLATKTNKTEIIITATDGEIYGHHHKNIEKLSNRVFGHPDLETVTFSQLFKIIPKGGEITAKKASWETKKIEIEKNNPFPLWKNPKNKIHQMLWQLANLAIKFNEEYNPKNKDIWARKHLNQGLASCSWWWASSRKPDVFSPIAWSPDEIEKGMENLIKSIRSLNDLPNPKRIEAEKLFNKLHGLVWRKHWTKKRK